MVLDLAALLKGVTAPKAVTPLAAPPVTSPISQALASILSMNSGQGQPNFSTPSAPVGGPPIFNFAQGADNSNVVNTGPALDPKVMKLANTNAKLASQATALGAPPTGKRPSLIHRVFDILSRPEYALSDAAKLGDAAFHTSNNSVLPWTQALKGLERGITGQDKIMPTDVIQQNRDEMHATGNGILKNFINPTKQTFTPGEAGPMQSVLGKVLGIGANVVSDPLNLVTSIGVPEGLTKAARVAGQLGEVSDATKAASRVAETVGISKPGELENLVKPPTSIPSVAQRSIIEPRVQEILGQLTPQLKQEHLALNTKLAEQAGLGGPTLRTGSTTTSRLAHTVANVKQLTPADLIGDSARAQTNRLAVEIHKQSSVAAKAAYKSLQSGVLEDMARGVSPATIRRAGVTVVGHHVTLTPEFISSKLRSVKEATGFGKAADSFSHAFVSTGKMSPEMASLSGISRGAQVGPHAEMIRQMGENFKGIHEKDIGPSLKHLTSNAPELGSNPAIEDAIKTHIGGVLENIRKASIPLKDVSAYMPPGLKFDLKGGGKDAEQLILHGKSPDIARQAFMRMLEPGAANPKFHALDYLGHLGNASIKARANAQLRNSLTQFGVKAAGNVANHLKNSYGYKELKQTPGFIYHPDIHTDASRMFELLGNHGQSEELTGQLGKIVTMWKKLATVYNLPSYPTRNFIANEYMANLVGGKTGINGLISTRMAAKAMRHKLDKVTTGHLDPAAEVLKREMDKEIPSGGALAVNHGISDLPGGQISPDLAWALYHKQGLESNFTTASFKNHPVLATGVRGVAHKVNEKVLNGNKNVEDFSRMGVFIHHLRTGSGTLDQVASHAANQVRKSLFDYSDVTPFEKRFMVKLFPFYKWNRKAIPALFHGLLDHPGKVLNVQMALQQGLADAGGHPETNGDPWGLTQAEPLSRIPSYILDRMGSPFGKEGKNGSQEYLDPAVPFNDELRLLGDPSSIISQISPALRVPIEDTMGKQFFHDLPIKNKAEYSTVGQINILRSLLKASQNSAAPVGASGQTGGSTATSKSPLDALLQTFNPLNGVIGAQQNTPKSQAATLLGHNTVLSKKIKALKAKAVSGK